MAWAKALVEISIENKEKSIYLDIELKQIAEKFIKYYWNQTIFFDLVQGSNLVKIPIILKKVKDLIKAYYLYIDIKKPDRFEKVEDVLIKKIE